MNILVAPFRLVRTRSVKCGVGVVCSFSLCRQWAFVPSAVLACASEERLMFCCNFSSSRQWAFDVNLSSDLGEAFLANFIPRNLNRSIEEVFGEEIVHRVEISSSSTFSCRFGGWWELICLLFDWSTCRWGVCLLCCFVEVTLVHPSTLFGLTYMVLKHASSNRSDDIELK